MLRLLAFASLLLTLVLPARAAASFADTGIAWRPFGEAAFREAREAKRPVFLVLTAPWTWDHFLLPERLFSSAEVRAALEAGWIPVLADGAVAAELRDLYTIPSGLLPSFHFLDAEGRPFASSAPLGPDELAFRLSEWVDPAERPVPDAPRRPDVIVAQPAKFAPRAARLLTELSERGELHVAPAHRDFDPEPLLFLAESSTMHVPRRSAEALAREISRLRGSVLIDRLEGGFHRAFAVPDSLPHFEKLLRQNAAMGRLLCAQFARTGAMEVGRDALLVLRFFNESLRTGNEPIYAASVAADVYDRSGREMIMTGLEYHARRDPARASTGRPPPSAVLPVGGNFAAMRAFATYASVFHDDRLVHAAGRALPHLLAQGFESDGRARRVLDQPGAGNLRDQADAGSGLLALHSLTGSQEALHAATRLAERMLEEYAGSKRGELHSVARDAALPRAVLDAPVNAAWNGEALRFLADLGATTRERRWLEAVRDGIAFWAERMPADGRGLGELAGAALRLQAPAPLFLLDAAPGGEEATRLLMLALSTGHPWLHVRWVAPKDRKEVERRFGVTFEERPALYLIWGASSGALRDADVLQAVWREASARAGG